MRGGVNDRNAQDISLVLTLFALAGEYRGAERQGEHPAAGLHLPAEAGGIRPHGGHGLRYPVCCQVISAVKVN